MTQDMKQDMNKYMFMSLRYRKISALLLAAMLTTMGSSSIMAQNQTQTGPTVHGSVYGGGNAADVGTDATVNITHGTVSGSVYGGGFGSSTTVKGDVTVNIGAKNPTTQALSGSATITGDVYGGSAKGKVNATKGANYDTNPTDISATEGKTTHVNIYGTSTTGINDVYGGGLGDLASLGEGHADAAADVYGAVTVSVEGGKARNIFGCNNVNGTPKSTVEVTVIGTNATVVDAQTSAKTYALQGVYGGGNLAHYDPTTPSTYPTVTISGCATSIKDVFGGGNAAAVPYTSVTINGGDIDRVFAGGNGESGTPAHIGWKTTDAPTDADIYIGTYEGAGKANLEIKGGTINHVFGGSNANGSIRVTGSINVNKSTAEGACDMKIGELYGGGNLAAGAASTITIGCTGSVVEGDNGHEAHPENIGTTLEGIGSVYGGANQADVSGNISLAINSGIIANVYGGNNTSGSISGTIAVNIEKTNVGCGWYVGNVFGGGNLASYAGSPTVTVKNGTVSGNVYGGGNGDPTDDTQTKGSTAAPTVTIGDLTHEDTENNTYLAIVLGDVYGGGNAAKVTGQTAPAVLVQKSNTEVGYVYGGGNAANVPATNVSITDGTIHHDVYGGGHGDKESLGGGHSDKAANVTGNVNLSVTGGKINKVFAGSNLNGSITGVVALEIDKAATASTMKIGEVYGGGNQAAGNAGAITIGCTGTWTIDDDGTDENNTFHNKHNNTNNRIGYELEGIGTVYGGANAANIGTSANPSNITLNINSGIVENVFGGNNASGTINGTIEVNIEKDANATCADSWYVGNVYGGGNLASYSGIPQVNIKNGTVSGNVYGGGLGNSATVAATAVIVGDLTAANSAYEAIVSGDVYGGGDAAPVTGNTSVTLQKANSSVRKLFGGGNAAGVGGNTQVEMTLGTITDGVYGGCNSSGTVTGTATVTLTGGTVGSANFDSENKFTSYATQANVHGGGYGPNTYVKGNVVVNIGESTTSGDVTIYGDVYGGGALGHVNAEANSGTDSATNPITFYTTGTDASTTTVNLYKGNIYGDAYGGGLGQITPTNSPAYVGGDVTVNQHEAQFHIRTSTFKNSANEDVEYLSSGRIFGANNINGSPKGHVLVHVYDTQASLSSYTTYDIATVFGGGNEADYDPEDSKQRSEVIIEGCTNTSIKDVYGGGNAAAVPASEVWILGSKIIDNVFGGGNGERGASYAANVGYHLSGTTTTPYANGKGDGRALVKLVGGTINTVYGGSNSNGDIRGGADISMPQKSEYTDSHSGTPSCCDNLTTANIYGGGKNADMSGGTVIKLGCINGLNNVFGGAKAANIKGGVNLVITGGTFANVFGGNDTSGTIQGPIKLYIEETCAALNIENLYLGGNLAPYSVYGYYDDNGTLKPRTSTDDVNAVAAGTTAPGSTGKYADPELYVTKFTKIDNVFGGGYGTTAVMYGSPKVFINEVPNLAGNIGEIENVFGGGNQATVNGNATINTGTSLKVRMMTDNGKEHDVKGVNITGNIYGGGNAADVEGDVTITIGTVDLRHTTENDGKQGTTIGGSVFGGGLGENTTVTGSVEVNVGGNIGTEANPSYAGYATIAHDVYGGSAKGKVNATKGADYDTDHTDIAASTGSKTTQVNLYGGTISGNLYGGGYGKDPVTSGTTTYDADVYGAVTVTTKNGNVTNVYGGNNVAGTTRNTIAVNIDGGTISENVYGGGDNAHALSSATVTMTNGTVTGNVFGGGNNADVRTNTEVNIGGNGQVLGNVYGGGNLGYVGTINTADINNYIWSNYTDADTNNDTGISTVNITGGTIGAENRSTENHASGHVFGAGKGSGTDSYYCEKGMVYKTNVNITKGTVYGNVYGGGEVGRVENNAIVEIGSATETDAPEIKGSVFGAGAGLETHGYSALVRNNTNVTIQGYAKVRNNVYGGGEIAAVGRYWVYTDNLPADAPPVPEGTIKGMPYQQRSGGICTVIVKDHAEIGPKDAVATETAGHVYGGGKGVEPHYISGTSKKMTIDGTLADLNSEDEYKQFLETLALATNTYVTIGGNAEGTDTKVKGSVYGGSENGFVQHNTSVLIQNGSTIGTSNSYGHIYGGGKGYDGFDAAGRVSGVTTLNISGGTAYGSVYGGGELGFVKGAVNVNVTGGIITKDVYGGGALANTNTENWNGTTLVSPYHEEAGLTVGTSVVTGLYTRSGEAEPYTYTKITTANTKAASNTKYYRLTDTKVNLLGGTINGDAYGGGLGYINANDHTKDVAAMVYGDVLVDLNGTTTYDTNGIIQTTPITTKGCIVNRVFGCNNVNGTPKGEVLVHVHATQSSASGMQTVSNKGGKNANTYDVEAVYGGGNQAEYYPVRADATDATEANHVHTNVIIEGCSLTSIKQLFGGGNAASTPSTSVIVNGAYEIDEVFGGGNGAGDNNPGANVGFHYYAADATNAQTAENRAANFGYGFGKAQVNINGGLIHSVYGGSNQKGNVREVAIAMLDKKDDTCDFEVGKAYGGGKAAPMDGRAVLSLGCVDEIDEVYGGAESADVHNDVELNITNGTYKRVFGGNNVTGTIDGEITINIEETGCNKIIIGQLFAGGNQAAYTTPNGKADPVINVKSFTSIGQIFGGGFGPTAVLTGNPTINIDEIIGDKAAEYAGATFEYDNGTADTSDDYTVAVPAHTTANTIGTIGDVYGGGYGADVNGNVTVNIGIHETIKLETTPTRTTGLTVDTNGNYTVTGVDIARSVYGGGYGANTTVTGNVSVNIGGEKATTDGPVYIGGNIAIGGSVYGGSALGAVNATRDVNDNTKLDLTSATTTTTVTLKKGTVSTAVFGGGMGNANTQAKVYGKAVVNFYGDVISEGLYGGCDYNGKMFNGTELNLMGGRIGNTFTAVPEGGIPEIVFGGGLGALTIVDGTVDVNMGTETTPGSCTIYSNVYGGSKNGSVAVANVNLYGGTIWGNVFGGGYQTAEGKTAATDVNVTLDGTKFECLYSGTGDDAVPQTGQIFGCNNLQGTPTGHVKVHVKKTMGSDKPTVDTQNNPIGRESRTTYDVAAIYGGGNQANYVPESNNEYAEVIIEGCEQTSIKDVYGGGNAAAVPATNVKIKGSYIINRVFGGGNGYGTNNPGADVGISDHAAYVANHANGTYGTGKAETKLLGGYINAVFGGSNSKGDIAGGTDVKTKVSTDDISDCCPELVIGGIYGAGSNADMAGDVNIVLDCMPDDYVGEVYGGAMNANIDGNVSLTVTSGKFGRVFGGNNSGGSINGSITVNVNEGGCKPLEIGELFGGGNAAPYSVYGTEKNSNGQWVAKTSGKRYVDEGEDAIKVNVVACTSIGKVYGGGFGSTAEVIGDTHIDINMMKGYVNDQEQKTIGRIGQVFGGGSAANVTGNTTIDVGTAPAYGTQENGVNITNGSYLNPLHNEYLTITAAESGIYGGGEAADVFGNTILNIGTVYQKLNTNITGNIFGGGYGHTTKVTGDVEVNIGKKTVTEEVATYAGFANITGDVYGGSAMGSVNAYDKDGVLTASEGKSTKVNLYGGSITGNLYGGGLGQLAAAAVGNPGDDNYQPAKDAYAANVYGPVTVTVEGGKATNVYGCNNLNGEPQSTVNVTINNTDEEKDANNKFIDAIGNVFGGGNQANYTKGTPVVLMAGGHVNTIFGGGDHADVAKNTSVTMTGGYVKNRIYGGGNLGSVGIFTLDSNDNYVCPEGTGVCNVTINDGLVGPEGTENTSDMGLVFGGGKGAATTFKCENGMVDKTNVTISKGTVTGTVYGGGEVGRVEHHTEVTIGLESEGSAPVIMGSVFAAGKGVNTHGYAALVRGNATLVVQGDAKVMHSVYGGGEIASVGRYKVAQTDAEAKEHGVEIGMPYSLANNGSGVCAVTVKGNAEIGLDDMKMTANGGPDDTGYVFGAGKGVLPYEGYTANEAPWRMTPDNTEEHYSQTGYNGEGDYETAYLKYIETLALATQTEVTISGNAFIKGSVYGGSENGHVQHNTHVTIEGGQIGNGDGINQRYTEDDWKKSSLAECSHWDYDATDGSRYDKYATYQNDGKYYYDAAFTQSAEGGAPQARDGQTFFGNVFGGGSGYYPYAPGKWHSEAGSVGGDTKVEIKGGHILSNVYGGNELTDVTGSTTIIMSGGTIGVPRTKEQVAAHPMSCSIFGGGKGDYRKIFNEFTNVSSTKVEVTGGTVYGSVFGGAEDGHVTGSTDVLVSGGTIGIIGIGGESTGNVYAGGKGNLNNVKAGLIMGNTKLNVTNGTIYHNIYGGGAYGSVGTYEYNADGTIKKYVSGGLADVIVNGGTIGVNGQENGMVFGSSRGDVAKPVGTPAVDPNDKLAWVNNTHVVIGSAEGKPNIRGTVYGSGENGHVFTNTLIDIHNGTIGVAEGESIGEYSGAAYPYRGNVYGGGCGTDMYDSDNDGKDDAYNPLAGIVLGNATINIAGGHVVRNVYGAGAMGSVGTVNANGTISGGQTSINISDGTIGVSGIVGDGNVFGAARGDANATSNEFALVRKNTNVSVTGGTVKGNVYGGGELGCVGVYDISSDYRTFTWKNTDGTDNTAANSDNKNTGICNVTVDGASAVINGHVFGAGKGKDDTFWCEKGIAYSTNVSIQNGTVAKNVYGGGEVGRVETDTKVKIGDGDGTEGGASAPTINGSVFGGGAGAETHGYSALVRGNTTVNVEGNAKVGHSVYGGGEIASVGKYGLDEHKMPSILQGGGYCYVTVKGHATITDDVFGAGEGVTPHFDKDNADETKRSRRMTLKSNWESLVGDQRFEWDYFKSESDYSTYLETLALATHPEVAIDGNATVNGSVFGGGELGLTKGSVVVNIKGGTIAKDVYGGGKLANTNTTSLVDLDGDGQTETVHPTTTVNLLGGTVSRDVYGGGLGDSDTPAYVYGDVNVNLNGLEPADYKPAIHSSLVHDLTSSDGYYLAKDGCQVARYVFGCNNINGTPKGHSKVHVFKTVNSVKNPKAELADRTTYDVDAVFGGGNAADYEPADTDEKKSTEVIIEGCDKTSIEEVYGGGYGAATPGTNVLIKGTYIINNVFGGGYGAGENNPGANVGYKSFPLNNPPATDDEKKTYEYGSGKVVVELLAGKVRNVYGGSNTKGDICKGASVNANTVESGDETDTNPCDVLKVDKIYGGGKDAPMEGGAEIVLDCMPKDWVGEIYAGAENADVENDVSLTITSGKFGAVYGGNKSGGELHGSITVNIEECDVCPTPIVIGELYGGGNLAPYSIYGYYEAKDVEGNDVLMPRTKEMYDAMSKADKEAEGIAEGPHRDPIINIRSFTSIGNVYGGGLGEEAVLIGNPTVNINEAYVQRDYGSDYNGETRNGVEIPANKKDAIGIIGHVYGGGNKAKVIGNTTVNVGTEVGEYVRVNSIIPGKTGVKNYFVRTGGSGEAADPYVYKSALEVTTAHDANGKAVENVTYYYLIVGANVKGNIYGGGNNAEVTGSTSVVIGKKKTE